jgi:hypothetical protein
MEPDIPTKQKIVPLTVAMEEIHFANCQYWQKGDAVNTAERAEHERRKAKLEEITAELAKLQSS